MKYQCAIIGGGLAGLCLAIQLRNKGLDVVLFEKEQYPFHKVCGEYISNESQYFLESLGVPVSQLNLPQISELLVSAPSGFSITHPLDLGGFGISRYKLDHMLFKIAKQKGVTVLDHTTVDSVSDKKIFTSQNVYHADLVFGSWGKKSKIDVQLKRDFQLEENRRLNNFVAVKYHVKGNLPPHRIELHNFKNGYCGISKIEDDKYCMCYLVNADELKRNKGSIRMMEENVLMRNPYLKDYFSRFESLYDKPLSISQISFSRKTQVETDIMMLGDAAGLIAPLCGNGMSMAMHASFILSNLVGMYFKQAVSYESLCKTYLSEWTKHFATRLKLGRMVQSFFGNECGTELFLRMLKPFPSVVSKMVKYSHGKPFGELTNV